MADNYNDSIGFIEAALLIPAELNTLTVNNGSGSGNYTMGTEVDIGADSPPQGHVFDRWTGDVEPLADVDSSITTIIMPALIISVTATYMADNLSGGDQYSRQR